MVFLIGMKSELQGQCVFERVGSLKEIVHEEEFLQERLRPFSKNVYVLKGTYRLRKKVNMNKQALFKTCFSIGMKSKLQGQRVLTNRLSVKRLFFSKKRDLYEQNS